MATHTPKLNVGELSPSQSQPELTVNAAILAIENALQISVISMAESAPPSSPDPEDGDAYIVKATGSGAWNLNDNHVAYFISGGWRFLTPKPGWVLYDQNTAAFYKFISGAWTVASI